MSLIMENWRHYVKFSVDETALHEEYLNFYALYDKYDLLNEAEQGSFLLEEAVFEKIIEFFKTIGKALGAHWKKLVAIFKSEDGILWKVMKTLGWTLDSLAEIFHAGFKALNLLQVKIIDLVKNYPFGDAVPGDTPGQRMTEWIKNELFEDKDLGNLSKFAVAGILLTILVATTFLGNGSPPFQVGLILAALGGKFAARDLFEDDFFTKIILTLASGVAINALFPGYGLMAGPVLGVLKKIVSVYKVGKFAKGLVGGDEKKKKEVPDVDIDVEDEEKELDMAAQ
jgi:hypothetical protein